jgi:hypothetical protein
MSDAKLPEKQTQPRSRTVKPGHLAVSEFAAGRIGASAPFGDSVGVPMPLKKVVFEPTDPAPARILEDERH